MSSTHIRRQWYSRTLQSHLDFSLADISGCSGSPTNSNAFIIPQWGSIFIYNPPQPPESHLAQPDLHPAFSVFRKQLLSLLGVPPLPEEVKSSEVLSDWALDSLLRRRAYENAEGSKDTLGSIVSLVHQIEGMPVDRDVTEDVREALDSLDKVSGRIPQVTQTLLRSLKRCTISSTIPRYRPCNTPQRLSLALLVLSSIQECSRCCTSHPSITWLYTRHYWHLSRFLS